MTGRSEQREGRLSLDGGPSRLERRSCGEPRRAVDPGVVFNGFEMMSGVHPRDLVGAGRVGFDEIEVVSEEVGEYQGALNSGTSDGADPVPLEVEGIVLAGGERLIF